MWDADLGSGGMTIAAQTNRSIERRRRRGQRSPRSPGGHPSGYCLSGAVAETSAGHWRANGANPLKAATPSAHSLAFHSAREVIAECRFALRSDPGFSLRSDPGGSYVPRYET